MRFLTVFFLVGFLCGPPLSADLPHTLRHTTVGRDGRTYLLFSTKDGLGEHLWFSRLVSTGKLDTTYGRNGVVLLETADPVEHFLAFTIDVDDAGRATLFIAEEDPDVVRGWFLHPNGSSRRSEGPFVFNMRQLRPLEDFPTSSLSAIHLHGDTVYAGFTVPSGEPNQSPHRAVVVRWDQDGGSPVIYGEKTDRVLRPDENLGRRRGQSWWVRGIAVDHEENLSVLFSRGRNPVAYGTVSLAKDLRGAVEPRRRLAIGSRGDRGEELLAHAISEEAWDGYHDRLLVYGFRTDNNQVAFLREFAPDQEDVWAATHRSTPSRVLTVPLGLDYRYTVPSGLLAYRSDGNTVWTYKVNLPANHYTLMAITRTGQGTCAASIAAAIAGSE